MGDDAPIVGTAANPSAFDPLDEMPADEPRFVLRGKDPAAPGAITEWARDRRNRAFREFNAIEQPTEQDRLKLKAELEQCREADDLAMQMREWQQDHAAPEGDPRATYNAIERTQEQLAEAARKRRLDDVHRDIQEGRYHVCNVRDSLEDMGLLGEETRADLDRMLERLQAVDDEHSTRRPEFKDQISIVLPPPAGYRPEDAPA